MSQTVYLSSSPHVHSGETTDQVMRAVIYSLLPACAVAVYFFGLSALLVLLIATLGCLATEVVCQRIMGQAPTLADGSAVVTGILLALNLPPTSPWWLTFKQARNLGGSVRRKQRSTPVVFWNWIERPATDEETGETKTVRIPLLRYYRVFNIEQCEGLPEKAQSEVASTLNQIQQAEQIIQEMPNRPNVQHNKRQAAYNPVTDIVSMPTKALFRNPEEYYSCLLYTS